MTQRDRRRRLDGLGDRLPTVARSSVHLRAEQMLAQARADLESERRRWHVAYMAVVTNLEDRRRLAALLAAREHKAAVPPEEFDSDHGRRWLDEILDPHTEAPDGTQ